MCTSKAAFDRSNWPPLRRFLVIGYLAMRQPPELLAQAAKMRRALMVQAARLPTPLPGGCPPLDRRPRPCRTLPLPPP